MGLETDTEELDNNQFRNRYGICKEAFRDLSDALKSTKVGKLSLLVFLYFVKSYKPYTEIGTDLQINERTIRVMVDSVFKALNDINPGFDFKSRLEQYPLILDGNIVYSVVDTWLFPINKPRVGSEKYYSPQLKRHGLKYEIVVDISNGRISWVNGPYGGSLDDLQISRTSLQQQILLPNERILGDEAYEGDVGFFTIGSSSNSGSSNEERIKYTSRKIIDNLFERFREFKVFADPWRGEIERLCRVVNAMFYIISLDLEYYPPKCSFAPLYYNPIQKQWFEIPHELRKQESAESKALPLPLPSPEKPKKEIKALPSPVKPKETTPVKKQTEQQPNQQQSEPSQNINSKEQQQNEKEDSDSDSNSSSNSEEELSDDDYVPYKKKNKRSGKKKHNGVQKKSKVEKSK
ncbi:hypothetical protein CYY_002829 [Polysphondylium violaceum]|uniref:DDE Tnp4 domain-containing protein n=1 Tax=Polysphondylium violaceum TaxID=133409 RepID=A0A8J4PVN6_9MYCE|nr:hypothetical protein CYY_002829 [Polysphondylium violaceum]